ncbi:cytochrome P460 family protein [Bradyrhizobium sp. dw_411]|uniref:cytochrome P460 family protein n=1 Tax=Bradyrhizobium sp. dw_411 TaxID=2720082 RepID=UPI0031FF1F77
MKPIKAVIGAAVFLAVFAVTGNVRMDSVAASGDPRAEAVTDANGNLHVPADYRLTYEFLGTWAVAADKDPGSSELHTVYVSPGSIAAYRKEGHFPDGAVLVKEVFKAATGEMTTGTISHADSLIGWFVMVKDSEGRYAGNKPVWGDGWGWSWFDAANPSVSSRHLPLPGGGVATSTDYRENCKSCHLPAQATDLIYVDGYPPLKR